MSFRYVIETENPIVTDGKKMFNCNDGKLRLRIVEYSHWNTGKPTEEGWYLVAYKKRDCDGSYYWEYGARLWIEIIEGEGDWNVCEEEHPVLAWQKIDPYKEASNG